MKICRNCMSEIPGDVKICPNCGKDPNKEKNYIPLMATLSVILFVGIGIATFLIMSGKNFKFDVPTSEKKSETVSETKGSIFKGEKTITCSKETTDEDGTKTKDDYIFVIKNDVIKELSETQTVKYNDELGEMSYGFTKLFVEALSKVEGLETNISEYKDNSFYYTMKINYEKLDIESLAKAFGDDEEFDRSSYDKNIKFSDYKKKNLEGYTCK